MALYHLSAKIISRTNGQSACAAAAYRSGEKIHNEYDGITHDYRRKQNVNRSIVLLPKNAPADFADRQKLWNSVEQNEKQANAQLSREIEFSLPRELPSEVRERIALEFLQENFVDEGMVVDVSFHNPPKMNSKKQPIDINGNVTSNPKEYIYNNPHCHALCTLRPLDESGKWSAKKTKLYVCVKDGIEQSFSSEDLKNNSDWEKQYRYINNSGKKVWLTKSFVESHPEEKYEQVNRYPKSEQIINPKVEKWNSQEMLIQWREAWAKKVNETFESFEMDERIDHRSYKDQGLNLIPTIHEGKSVTIKEKELLEEYHHKISLGEQAVRHHTEIRELNNAIREHNQEVKIIMNMHNLQKTLEDIVSPVKLRIKNFSKNISEKLEILRAEIIKLFIRIKHVSFIRNNAFEKIQMNKDFLKDLSPSKAETIDRLLLYKKELEHELNSTNNILNKKKYEELKNRIEQTENSIELHKENMEYAEQAQQEILKSEELLHSSEDTLSDLKTQLADLKEEYILTEKEISLGQMQDINKERLEIRTKIEKEHLSDISSSDMSEASIKIDDELNSSIHSLSDQPSVRIETSNINFSL